jgi:hypothetical protein
MANIGPGELDAIKDSPFLLSRAEWLRIQRYVGNAIALPHTETDLRRTLEMPADMKIDEFKALLEGYQAVQPHVTQWRDKTFPNTVALAANISQYGTKAPISYKAINVAINELLVDSENEGAKKKLVAVIQNLSKEAAGYAAKADAAYKEIQKFAQDTAADKTRFDRLAETYEKKFGANSKKAIELTADIKETRDLVETVTTDYEYNKAVACGTVSYAWIIVPPIGLIAAVIVAGIYGDKAVKAKERLDNLKKKLGELEGDQRFALQLIGIINIARDGLHGIQKDITEALPAIQKIQGVWDAIASDLKHIGEIIATDIEEAILEIKDLGVELAIAQWQDIKKKADAYRAHAYIEVSQSQAA